MNRDDALAQAWSLYNKYPNKRSAILSKLPDYNITVDEFNTYDSTMTANIELDILEDRADKLKEVPGFSQVDTMSDTEILRVFNSRDELYDKLESVGRPPSDADWYKAGLEAEERIAMLTPFYETKMAEEWEQFEPGIPLPFWGNVGAAGPMQLLTNLAGGWTDLGYDKKERFHEKGLFTSLNPLTGFGAWELAEFQRNPEGGMGFSDELLEMEDELEELYGSKRQYEKLMNEGGYREAYNVEQELAELNQIIMDNKLLDPRILGETQ